MIKKKKKRRKKTLKWRYESLSTAGIFISLNYKNASGFCFRPRVPCYVLSCPCVMSSRVMSYVMSLRVMSRGVEHGLYFLFAQNGEPKNDNMKMRFIFSLPLSKNFAFNRLTRSSIELERPSSSVAAPLSSAALSGSLSASAASSSSASSLSSASFSSASFSSASFSSLSSS